MLSEHIDLIESLGLKLFFVAIFLLIGLAIHDVLKRGNVPRFGRLIVWLVLFLGCAGFVAKGLIEMGWEGSGIGSLLFICDVWPNSKLIEQHWICSQLRSAPAGQRPIHSPVRPNSRSTSATSSSAIGRTA